jgi:anthranilate phosphoribosyltransferase
VLREHMVCWDPGRDDVLDTCGTGGDGAGTFNISTAAALVVAACGVAVVKHGNRSVSSRSGSADVLKELGVSTEGDAASARRCLDRTGLAFCFAPLFHPAMRHVAVVRRRLGVPTLFNCLGPLANPARSSYQLLGVGRRDLLERMAGALAHLGTRQALVVHGEDGLDEVSLSGPTQVRQVRGGQVSSRQWTAQDFGLEPCRREDLCADGPAASAALIRRVLRGADIPAARVVLANAAAALLAAEKVVSLEEGVHQARQAVTAGRAWEVLHRLIQANEVHG